MKLGHVREAPRDPDTRNPLTLASSFSSDAVAENTARTTAWTYTVPAGKKARINGAAAFIVANVGFTSVVVTDATAGIIAVTPSGGAATDILTALFNSNGVANNGSAQASLSQPGTLQAGDAMLGDYIAQGSAAGAGRAHVRLHAFFTEFDI